MPISPIQSGYSLLQQSQSLAKEAAGDITDQTTRNDLEFNQANKRDDSTAVTQSQAVIDNELKAEEKKEAKPVSSTEDALLKLQQASTYSRAGANIIERSNEMVGTLLDTRV